MRRSHRARSARPRATAEHTHAEHGGEEAARPPEHGGPQIGDAPPGPASPLQVLVPAHGDPLRDEHPVRARAGAPRESAPGPSRWPVRGLAVTQEDGMSRPAVRGQRGQIGDHARPKRVQVEIPHGSKK